MPNGGVTKDTFEKTDTNSKLNVLFDQNQELIEIVRSLKHSNNEISLHCQEQWQSCDTRFKKLERYSYKIQDFKYIVY